MLQEESGETRPSSGEQEPGLNQPQERRGLGASRQTDPGSDDVSASKDCPGPSLHSHPQQNRRQKPIHIHPCLGAVYPASWLSSPALLMASQQLAMQEDRD